MVGDDPRGGGMLPLTMELLQLVGLTLELREVGTRREGTCRHVRSFRGEPDVRGAGRKKRDSIVLRLVRWDSVPFRGRGAPSAPCRILQH